MTFREHLGELFGSLILLGVGITVTIIFFRIMKGSKLKDWFKIDAIGPYVFFGGAPFVVGIVGVIRGIIWLLGEL